VLKEAQAKGYAEADPTEDVGGFDARAKLSILMRLALRVEVNPEEIVPRPITTITGTWAAPSGRLRVPTGQAGKWRQRLGRCWWICARPLRGRAERRTW
jgi:homoserine dehydrogenase